MFNKKHKTKEQIIWEKQQEKLKAIRGKFIDERLMPFLEKNTENLEEAQFLTESLKVAINQAFQMQAKTMPLSELKMKESLSKVKKPELVKKHVDLINVLEEQPIEDCVAMLDGVFNEANRVIMQQFKNKKLTDFKDTNIAKLAT